MKKCFIIGLIMAMMPNMGIGAGFKSVDQLIAEKQAKMEKLKKCKGTTKNLKIAGISTLGITAVGVGANIAEAVILKDEQGKLETERANLKTAKDKNEQLKSKQGKTDTSTKKYEGDCDKYVGEVYDAVKESGKCPTYSNMNICKDDLIKNIKDDKDKDAWVNKAKEVCEKNTKKNEEKTFKSVCKRPAVGNNDDGVSTNYCIFASDKYLKDAEAAKSFMKDKISDFTEFGCDINNITQRGNDNYHDDGIFAIYCKETDKPNVIWIQHKNTEQAFVDACESLKSKGYNGGYEGGEHYCNIKVTGTVDDKQKKAEELAKELKDVGCDGNAVKHNNDDNIWVVNCKSSKTKSGETKNRFYAKFGS